MWISLSRQLIKGLIASLSIKKRFRKSAIGKSLEFRRWIFYSRIVNYIQPQKIILAGSTIPHEKLFSLIRKNFSEKIYKFVET